MNITGNGILFTNWTNEDFTWTFAKEPYTFPARTSTTIALGSKEHNLGIANLFAKHLVNRELDKMNLPTNHQTRQKLLDKCFIEVVKEEVKPQEAQLSADMAEPAVEAPVEPKKKLGRPKKIAEEFV